MIVTVVMDQNGSTNLLYCIVGNDESQPLANIKAAAIHAYRKYDV